VLQPASYRDDIRISKILPFGDRYKLYLSLDIFNIGNNWSPTGMFTEAFTESDSAGTCGAGLNPCLQPAGGYYTGSGDALNPDGTEARRMQVSARFNF